jgi:hypothetical protein
MTEWGVVVVEDLKQGRWTSGAVGGLNGGGGESFMLQAPSWKL